jgi:hypothetical protein
MVVSINLNLLVSQRVSQPYVIHLNDGLILT